MLEAGERPTMTDEMFAAIPQDYRDWFAANGFCEGDDGWHNGWTFNGSSELVILRFYPLGTATHAIGKLSAIVETGDGDRRGVNMGTVKSVAHAAAMWEALRKLGG